MNLPDYIKAASLALFLNSVAISIVSASEYIREGEILPLHSAEEGIRYIPDTGNYMLTYKVRTSEGKKMLYRIEFVPATKISPELVTRFRMNNDNTIRYSYKVYNGEDAAQTIRSIMILTSSIVDQSIQGPGGWRCNSYQIPRNRLEGNSLFLDTNVAWSDKGRNVKGVRPGKPLTGFSYSSYDLPGIGKVKLSGYIKQVMGYIGEGPQGDVGAEFEKLITNDFVVRLEPVAHIPVESPFNAARILTDLKRHIDTDLIELHQIEPALVTRLDRRLETAILAANQGNIEAAENDIEAIMRLIRQESEGEAHDHDHDEKEPSLGKGGKMTKQASRVLIFNLNYIKKRLKSGNDGRKGLGKIQE